MANIHDVNESLQVQPSVRNLPTLIALSQGENGRSLQFRMVGATIPSGSSASLSGTKPDGVVYSKAGTVDGNTVIFQEDVQLTAVAGAWDAKIHIVNSGDSVATALIRFIIDPDPVDPDAIPSDSQLEGIVAECRAYAEEAKNTAYGSPLTATTASGMTDKTRVYVYTGSETGYTVGNWYYWNGSAWTSGGVYNSVAVQTDTTLTLAGHAADSKAVGDKLTDLSILEVPVDYSIAAGYYDVNNGSVQNPSGYWQEKRVTKFSTEHISKIKWSFDCATSVTQGNISLAKWNKSGTFIERVNLKTQSVYDHADGVYAIEDNVGFIGLSFSTRGYDVTFRVIAMRDLTGQLNEIESDISDIQSVVGDNEEAVNNILASRWTESDTSTPLSLLHFSDIHRQSNALERILKFKSHLDTMGILDGAIHTGDIVITASDESTQFSNFWSADGAENIMLACGNHDWYKLSATPHGKMTIAEMDAMYFQNVDNWDVERTGTNPYYYKDYDTQKVRLIVADPAVTSEEADETTWLNGVLSDAITNDYAVIVATHFVKESITFVDNNWTEVKCREAGTQSIGYDWNGCDIVRCVTQFINNSGKFICYLAGHTHYDYLAYPTGHSDQLIVTVASASWRRYETPLRTNDLPRYDETRTRDCFNIVTVDTARNVLKCVRVGSDMNMYEQPRKAFSYNYDTNTFISVV